MDGSIPAGPLRPCCRPGCTELVERGLCQRHVRQAEAQRGTTRERGYADGWPKVRLAVLRRDLYTCQIRTHCNGARATEVDHIRPISEFPEGRLLMTNLRSVCHPCHAARHNRILPRRRDQPDGVTN